MPTKISTRLALGLIGIVTILSGGCSQDSSTGDQKQASGNINASTPPGEKDARPASWPVANCSAPQWAADDVYTGGMQAVFDSYLWQASYWTQGNQPAGGGSTPWTVVGYCGSMPGPAAGRLFAPYVDVTQKYPLATNSSNIGNHYTLAFIIDSGGCTASWAGSIPLSSNLYLAEVAAIRAKGGDVVVSFGGAAGSELATTCTNTGALKAQYQAVINQYSLKHIDFSIEGAAVGNIAANATRNTVIAALQKANPKLTVSFTLPALPSGVTSQGIALLQDAVSKGVKFQTVNILAMDFGTASDNIDVGLNAMHGAWSTMNQLENLYPTETHAQIAAKVGIIPMIGQNDVSTEVFNIYDASELIPIARSNGIGFLGYWSETRDTPCPAGTPLTPAQGSCSGTSMTPFAFASIFKSF